MMVQVGALVTLYSSQEDQSSAADVFSKAISWYQNNDVSVHTLCCNYSYSFWSRQAWLSTEYFGLYSTH